MKDIHKGTLPVYGDTILSHTEVYNWVEKFLRGRSKIVAEDRRGRRLLIATKANELLLEELIRVD